jgi:hypothetical protein
MKELFTDAERDHLARFISAIDDILPKGDFARTSGTTERAIRSIFPLAQKIPLLGQWTDVVNMLKTRNAIIQGERRAAPMLLPGAMSGAGVQGGW